MAPRSQDGFDTPSTTFPRYTPPPLPQFAQRALERRTEGAAAPARIQAPPALAAAPKAIAARPPARSPAAFPRPLTAQAPYSAPMPVLPTPATVCAPAADCSHAHDHAEHHHDHHHGHEHHHGHSHGGCDHDHGILGGHTHDYSHLAVGARNRSLLRTALLIQAVFLVAEVAGGLAFNSLALLSDAAHMLADVAAIALALAAAHMAQGRPKNADGHARTELVAASINGYTLLIATGVIAFEGMRRLMDPPDVLAGGTMVIAVLGLLANIATALVLMRADQDNVNIKATLAHTITDAISSVGVIAAAALIAITGAHILDPLVSLVLAVVIGRMAWTVTSEARMGLRSWRPAIPTPAH